MFLCRVCQTLMCFSAAAYGLVIIQRLDVSGTHLPQPSQGRDESRRPICLSLLTDSPAKPPTLTQAPPHKISLDFLFVQTTAKQQEGDVSLAKLILTFFVSKKNERNKQLG